MGEIEDEDPEVRDQLAFAQPVSLPGAPPCCLSQKRAREDGVVAWHRALGAHGLWEGPGLWAGPTGWGGCCWRTLGLMQLPLCPAPPGHPSADPIHPSGQLSGDPRCRLLS